MAGEDVFAKTNLQFGGAFAADKGLITPNKGLTGIMMQNLSLTYSQNVTRIYEIGPVGAVASVYYIGGRSQGSMQAAHVIGPKLSMKAYYTTFSDVCEAGTNDIEVRLSRADCSPAAPAGAAVVVGALPRNPFIGGNKTVSYKAKFCVLIQIGMSVSAQDMVINENSQLMFSNLEYNEEDGL